MILTPRPAQERKINGNDYRITPLGAKQGCKVMTRLTKLLGGAVGKGASDAETLIFGALGELEDGDLQYFCDAFAPYTTVFVGDGKWPALDVVFELHFASNYGELFEWLMECFKINFGSVFETAKAALATQKAAAQKSPEKASS